MMDNQVELNIKLSLVLLCSSDLMEQSPVPLNQCECQGRDPNLTFEDRGSGRSGNVVEVIESTPSVTDVLLN